MNPNLHSGIALFPLFYLFAIHFIGDYVMQDDKTAKGKATSIITLSYHVILYALLLFVAFSPLGFKRAAIFAALNFLLHFITDFFTSKINKRLWDKGDTHNFFIGIFSDQYIHFSCLILTYKAIYD